MPILTHKFHDHKVSDDTEILILGTFIHDRFENGDFFYGRLRSFLWHLLPICFGMPILKEASLDQKLEFMADKKIDFADVIHALDVPEGEEENLEDAFIDEHVSEWKDLIKLVDQLPKLKAVYFTRKTFNSIPAVRQQVVQLAKHCMAKNIRFCKLETPAKFFDPTKQQQWIDTIVNQRTCLKA